MQNRTHTCAELRLSDAGKRVQLSGWMDSVRIVSANLAFVILRDFYGTTQVVIDDEEQMKIIRSLNKESVISVTGIVRERDNKNPKIPTGDIEVEPEKIDVLGRCRYNELPFQINRSREADESIRLKYRYLDLRNPAVKSNIILRCNVIAAIRKAGLENAKSFAAIAHNDTGMGRECYSIIGQGRIDEILSQKSGDRREIIEAAAGISRFRYRKEETERKLERTEENLVRINDKIAELELQVEPLRAQAETATQYLISRDELRLLEISVWLENLETLKTNAIKLDTDLSLAREELKKANADLEALYAASEQFSARIHENDIAQEEKRAQLSELDAQVKEQEAAVAVLQTGIAHNEENIARVEEELRSQSDRVGSMDAQIAQQRARIEELERSKNEVETALSALLKQAEELSKNAGEAASEAETLRAREALALSAAADSRAEVAALRSTLSEMDERESAIAAEQESGEAQLSETRKSAAENRKALESAQEEADAIRNIIAGHTMKMQGRIEREKETGEQPVSHTEARRH